MSAKTGKISKDNDEDNRLHEWKTHLQQTRQFEKKVCSKLERNVRGLQIVIPDYRRKLEEEKILLEHAQTPVVDKYRGKPNFFQTPPHLKAHPSLKAVLTKKQDYEVPVLEYVGIPNAILEEKHIEHISSLKAVSHDSYKRRRMRELKSGIDRIQSHKPSMSELVILGTKIRSVPPTSTSESTPEVTSENECTCVVCEGREKVRRKPSPVAAIRIEDKEFFSNNPNQKSSQHYVTIDTDTSQRNNSISKTITIKNVGQVALHYYWQLLTEERALDFLPQRVPAEQFVFKRNLTRLLPGESELLDIHFPVDGAGVFKETWQLHTKPPAFTNGTFLLRLWANVDCSMGVVEALQLRIEEQLFRNAVVQTVQELLTRVEASEHFEAIKGFVRESDLFEVTNADYSRMDKDPLYYCYNAYLVSELKRLYNQVKTVRDPDSWNYNLRHLHNLIKFNTSIQEQAEYFFIYDNILTKFQRIRKRDTSDYSYDKAYDVLCGMFDVMTQNIDELRFRFQIRKVNQMSKIPIEPEPEMPWEEPKLWYIRPKETEMDSVPGMEDIPTDDVAGRYKLYAKERLGIIVKDISDTDVDQVKGKGKKGKESAKGKKKDTEEKKNKDDKSKNKEDTNKLKKKERSGRSLTSRQLRMLEPSASDVTSLQSRTISITAQDLSSDSFQLYQFNLYSMIYVILGEYIEKFEQVLTHAEQPVSRQELRRIVELRDKTGMDFTASASQIETSNISKLSLISWKTTTDNISLASLCRSYSTDLSKSSLYEGSHKSAVEENVEAKMSKSENVIAQPMGERSRPVIFKLEEQDTTKKVVNDIEIDVEELLRRHLKIRESEEHIEEYEKCEEIKSATEISDEFFY